MGCERSRGFLPRTPLSQGRFTPAHAGEKSRQRGARESGPRLGVRCRARLCRCRGGAVSRIAAGMLARKTFRHEVPGALPTLEAAEKKTKLFLLS